MSGWYKHDRDMFLRPWAKDPKMVSVYDYLHCVAYVNDGILHGQKIRRGSCLTTRAAITGMPMAHAFQPSPFQERPPKKRI